MKAAAVRESIIQIQKDVVGHLRGFTKQVKEIGESVYVEEEEPLLRELYKAVDLVGENIFNILIYISSLKHTRVVVLAATEKYVVDAAELLLAIESLETSLKLHLKKKGWDL